ncbi:MAG TPA: energy transducer TonB [Longimicrobium sp.]
MKMISLPRLALCLAIAVSALQTPAGAQQETVGAFQLRVERDSASGHDRSTAVLAPRRVGPDGRGSLTWACTGPTGEMSVALDLGAGPREGQRRVVTWYFVGGPSDTSWVEMSPDAPGWVLHQADAETFTAQAVDAAELMLRAPGATPRDTAGAFFVYELAGVRSALGRLPCSPIPPLAAEADEGTYELNTVEEMPQPTNIREFSQALNAGYPAELRGAGVTGTVEVRFRLLPDGIVDPGSIQVMSSSHEQFNEPTLRAVRMLRFRPARVNGRPVRVWITLPVLWTVS